MPLDIEEIRRKREAAESGGGRFKPEKGKNFIRVLPFKHKVSERDVKQELFPAKYKGKTIGEFARDVTTQWGIAKRGPILATMETIQAWSRLAASASTKKEEEAADNIKPSNRYAMNIVNLGKKGNAEEVIQYLAPKTVYAAITDIVLDEEFGESVIGPEGRDFIIKYDPSKQGRDMYSVTLRDADKSEELDEDLLEQVIDPYTAEGLKAFGVGIVDEDFDADDLAPEDEGEEEEPEEEPEDEEEEQEEEPEEEEKPKAKKKAGKKKTGSKKKSKAKKKTGDDEEPPF